MQRSIIFRQRRHKVSLSIVGHVSRSNSCCSSHSASWFTTATTSPSPSTSTRRDVRGRFSFATPNYYYYETSSSTLMPLRWYSSPSSGNKTNTNYLGLSISSRSHYFSSSSVVDNNTNTTNDPPNKLLDQTNDNHDGHHESSSPIVSASSTPQPPPPPPQYNHEHEEPFITVQQQSLLDYTQSILPPITSDEYPIGTLSYTQLISISNCINQWISTGEHRYLGAQQALILLKRLIMERGGGYSLLLAEEKEDKDNNKGTVTGSRRRNENVSYGMYHIHSIIHYLNALYSGNEFQSKIMDIVTTLEEEYEQQQQQDDFMDEVPYKDIISTLCTHRTSHAALAAELLLSRFETKLLSTQNTGYEHSNPPTVETYNNVLTCWYKSGHHSYPPQQVVDSTSVGNAGMNRGQEFQLEYMHHPNPCSNLLTQMLVLHEIKNSTDGSKQHDEDGIMIPPRTQPDFVSFNTTISSLSKEQIDHSWRGNDYHRTIGKQCYLHLMKMLEFYHAGDRGCAPDLITFSTVVNTLGRGSDKEDEVRAREILDAMISLSGCCADNNVTAESYEFDVVPRNKHFNVVLALMASKQRVDVETLNRAKYYVNLMEQLDQRSPWPSWQNLPQRYNEQYDVEGGNAPIMAEDFGKSVYISESSCAPDVVTYNTLIKVAARAGKPDVAEDILNTMIDKSSNGESEVKPDSTSFNTVLMAWSRSRRSDGKKRATELLQRMQEMAENGDTDVKPDRASLTTVINALVTSAGRSRAAPLHAEKIVERMESNKDPAMRPDAITYTSLIKCWIESGRPHAAERAEEIINRMHQRYDDGYEECKPDTITYNVALNALAKSGYPDSAKRAGALLDRMQDRYYDGDADLTPTTQSFSTVIQAWARSKDPKGAMKATKLLETMHESGNVSPNTIAYSSCILAWRNSGARDAGTQVDALLKKMKQYEEAGVDTLKPNAIAYTTAMEAWISSRHPHALERVEAILEHMIERSLGGDGESAPTSTTFNVVLKAIQNSSFPEKHEKARLVIDCMQAMARDGHRRATPTIVTYNSFFSACARTKGDAKTKLAAFNMVINALIEIQESDQLRPDLYTWPAVWNACQELLDFKRDLAWINRIFELTVRSGMVNEYLFNNMRNYLPPQYLQKKLKTTKDVHHLTPYDLPTEWTRNVKLARAPRGQRRERAEQEKRGKAGDR